MPLSLENLPSDVLNDKIVPFISNNTKDLSPIVLASKELYSIFQPKRLIEPLLKFIAYGNQDVAKKILTRHPHLMVEFGSVTDDAKRRYECISPFMLLLWQLDTRYMAYMMLGRLPQGKEGERIKNELLKQHQEVMTKGVTFTFEGKEYTEKHFDFQGYFDALDSFQKDIIGCEIEQLFVKAKSLSDAQKLLPKHVIDHFSDAQQSLNPTPEFNKKQFKRNQNAYDFIVDGLSTRTRNIGINKNSLGDTNLVFLRGGRPNSTYLDLGYARKMFDQVSNNPMPKMASFMIEKIKSSFPKVKESFLIDMDAVSKLYSVRINDCELLQEKLKLPLEELIKEMSDLQEPQDLEKTSRSLCAIQ